MWLSTRRSSPLNVILLFLALVSAAPSASAQFISGMDAEIGTGRSVDMARVGLLHPWVVFSPEGQWQFHIIWDFQGGRWKSHSSVGANQTLWDVGATPIIRFERTHPGAIAPFMEGAVGFHLISHNHINNRINMGSAFQFGDHLGAGIRVGPGHALEIAYRHQHLSNASLGPPNDGINFNQLRVAVWF
jgi:hypothetical protein